MRRTILCSLVDVVLRTTPDKRVCEYDGNVVDRFTRELEEAMQSGLSDKISSKVSCVATVYLFGGDRSTDGTPLVLGIPSIEDTCLCHNTTVWT